MLLHFAHNNDGGHAAPHGMDMGQDIEPAGYYVVVQDAEFTFLIDGWTYGRFEPKSPIELEHVSTSSTGWKRTLSDMYDGLTGKALTEAIKASGHDMIITRDDSGEYSECVILN